MLRVLIVLAAVAATPPAAAIAGEGAWAAACRHYENRARFKSRAENVEFATVLAEGCGAALHALEARGPDVAAARRFLDGVARARAEVDAINAGRLAAAARRAEPGFSRRVRNLLQEMRLVTETGEYLILRAEGVFEALDAWVADGGRFALATALP